ncbi:MAG: alpha/beta fold hydrolase [Labilithrix sp.]|nr:alpha/beta fold hydrolase [Labilithrix sp.]MCW5812353.1 alpha/beta fold hydrolase [Labilithrix sp.]
MFLRSIPWLAVAIAAAGCSAATEDEDESATTESAATEALPCPRAPCAARPVVFIHGHNGHNGDGDAIFAALTAPGERWDARRSIGTGDHADWAARSIPRREWLFAFDYYVTRGSDAPKSFTAGPGRIGSNGQLVPDSDSYDRGVTHDFTKDLAAAIDDILRATGADKVDVVAHSMGGLITRSYLAFFPGAKAKIGEVLFLATPHQGVPFAVGESWFSDDPIWMDDHELTELDRVSWTARSKFTVRGRSGRDVWTKALMKAELAQPAGGPVKHCMKGAKDRFIFDDSARYERCADYQVVGGVDHGGLLRAREATDFARAVLGGTITE